MLLIRILPAFLATMALWQYAGLAKLYHACLAVPLDVLLPAFDPSGLVKGVGAEGDDLFVRILYQGRRLGLSLTAQDITSNTVLLIALFLSSPFTPSLRRHLISLGGSLGILFIVHVVTVAANVQFALMANPEITTSPAGIGFLAGVVVRYRQFYIEYGMYLFVIVLWSPYFIASLARGRGSEGTPAG
ncbi:MAG: hypothetical protein ACE5EO_05680 [Candidatus Krumholzibacteriia bacterium]